MKIAFIVPNSVEFLGSILTSYPPLGILYLTALAKKRGHEVRIWDADTNNILVGDAVDELEDWEPGLIGLSLTTPQIPAAVKLTSSLRRRLPEIPMVVGGPHPSVAGIDIFKHLPDITYSIMGEGETAFLELLEHLDGERKIQDVSSLIHNTGTEVIASSSEAPLIRDLDELPMPSYESVADWIHKYPATFPSRVRPSLHIMASRGCPFSCKFCSNAVFGRKLRLRSPENVVDEIEYLSTTFNVREIFFQDDTGNSNRKWFEHLCEEIMRRDLNKKVCFKIPFRVNQNILDLELLKLAKRAGFWMIFYGVESGDQNILDNISKGIRVEEVERAFALTSEAKLFSYAAFMIGNLGETYESCMNSLKLFERIKPDFFGFSVAYAFPGTEFYEISKKSNLLEIDDPTIPTYFHSGITRTESLSGQQILDIKAKMDKEASTLRLSKQYERDFIEKYGASDLEWASLRLKRQESSDIWYDYNFILPEDLEDNISFVNLLQDRLVIGNHIGFLGEGWHLREYWPPAVRNTKKRARFYMTRPKKEHAQLEIEVFPGHPRLDKRPTRVAVFINEIKELEVTLCHNRWQTLAVPLSDEHHGAAFLNIALEVDRTWCPSDFGMHGDDRELGIAVSEAGFRSAEENEAPPGKRPAEHPLRQRIGRISTLLNDLDNLNTPPDNAGLFSGRIVRLLDRILVRNKTSLALHSEALSEFESLARELLDELIQTHHGVDTLIRETDGQRKWLTATDKRIDGLNTHIRAELERLERELREAGKMHRR